MTREVLTHTIYEPNTGLLGEVHRALLSIQFNATSQRKVLEQIQRGENADSLGLPVIKVIQERSGNYLLCAGFRHYQLLRAAGAETLSAKLLPTEDCLNNRSLQAFRQEIIALLAYDCTTRQPHPQLRELKKYLINHATPELLQLVNSDVLLKSVLNISARELRTHLKKKVR